MAKLVKRVFGLLLCFCWSIKAGAAPPEPATITMVTDAEKAGGYLVELTTQVFKRVGYNAQIEYLPWTRALDMALQGQADGLLGCYYADERARHLLYSEPIAQSAVVFYALDTADIRYSRLEDLSPYVIGTINGVAYPHRFATATFLTKEPSTDYLSNIRKLLAGRIDLFIEKQSMLRGMLAGLPHIPGAEHIVPLEPPLSVNKLYNAFSRRRPDAALILSDFNRGLALIKEEGLYTKIITQGVHE